MDGSPPTAEDLLGYVDELETILPNNDVEHQAMKKVDEVLMNAVRLRQAKEQEFCAAIEALLKNQAEAHQVSEQIDEAKSRKLTLLEKCDEVKKKLAQAEEQKRECGKAQDENDQKRDARHIVSLYSSASHIKWDFESDPDEVKGLIINSSGIKPFCLNRKENSQFFITNYLWDLMEPDWD